MRRTLKVMMEVQESLNSRVVNQNVRTKYNVVEYLLSRDQLYKKEAGMKEQARWVEDQEFMGV